MAAATKEIRMDAEAATLLSKPDGAFRVGKKGKQKRPREGYFLCGKAFSGRFDNSFLSHRSGTRHVVSAVISFFFCFYSLPTPHLHCQLFSKWALCTDTRGGGSGLGKKTQQ